jgi:hypothetical protein
MVNDFWGFPNQQDEIRNNLMLTHEVPGGFQTLDEADIQVLLNSPAVELIEDDLEQLIVVIEPEDVILLWRGLR